MAYEENLKSRSMDVDSSVGIYTGVPGQPGSAVPNTGVQYRGLKITGKHQVGLATASTDSLTGVLQNKPQRPGAAATVGYEGVSKVMSGGVFSAGDELVVDSTSRFIAGTTTGKGHRVIAQAASTGAGQLVPAEIL